MGFIAPIVLPRSRLLSPLPGVRAAVDFAGGIVNHRHLRGPHHPGKGPLRSEYCRIPKGLKILDAVVCSCTTTTLGRQDCKGEGRESQQGEGPKLANWQIQPVAVRCLRASEEPPANLPGRRPFPASRSSDWREPPGRSPPASARCCWP